LQSALNLFEPCRIKSIVFRHVILGQTIAPVAKASLCGFGIGGYALAIDGLAALIGARRKGSKP